MAPEYDFAEVETRWQRYWVDNGSYEIDNDDPRPPYYVLSMYPYPSGPAHLGHVRNYTFGDVLVRFRTMLGYGVLSPFGFDSFGLPAENAAIKGGLAPLPYTEARMAELKQSVLRLGAAYDWRREIKSHDPLYMKFNQVIFKRMFEAGLAYRKEAPVNWCPGCHTVLANEQVEADGTCERSGDLVEKRNLEQWFFAITKYADELVDALPEMNWPERVKTMQRNWIGRSEGATMKLPIVDQDGQFIEVYTTRPDTSFGMTYVVLAPEHAQVAACTTPEQQAAVADLVERTKNASDLDRLSTEGAVEKRGAFTGSYVTNPFNGENVPIYIADYVLSTYGTGAIMAVPAEDQRDYDFAMAYDLPIVRTVEPPADFEGGPYSGDGLKINSGFLNGLNIATAKQTAIDWLETEGIGTRSVQYRLRDWLISRQRYWGCPIPAVYCPNDGIVMLNESDLPLLLPEDVEFLPTGESPLKNYEPFLNTTCPKCGGPAKRETDTMDTFVDSSWYFLRFTDPWNTEIPADLDAIEKFLPINQYIGGITHAILHLLYARFYTRVLSDLGLSPKSLREPVDQYFAQGMIRLGGKAMSKSKGNVISPNEYFESVGADALRLCHLFVGPATDDVDWGDHTNDLIDGCSRYLRRVWRLATDDVVETQVDENTDTTVATTTLVRVLNKKVRDITSDMERFAFNTAVASCMELTNAINDARRSGVDKTVTDDAIDALLKLLAPMVPHLAAEAWQFRHDNHVHEQKWPTFEEALIAEDHVTMIIQVDGKVRDRIEVEADISEELALATAMASDNVIAQLGGLVPTRIVNRAPKLINLVTK